MSKKMSKELNDYCVAHGIRRTLTQGYDPSANGAAEQAVGYLKRKSRHLLAGCRLSTTWWGMATKTAAYYARCEAGLYPYPRIPFGTRVMCVRDPVPRDAFASRSACATCFGPSEVVPGGYTVYIDGQLKDVTNILTTNLDAHDITFVKSHIDEWEQPLGIQAPAPPESFDAAAAPDPSIKPRGRVRRQPEEQAAPEEAHPRDPLDPAHLLHPHQPPHLDHILENDIDDEEEQNQARTVAGTIVADEQATGNQ